MGSVEQEIVASRFSEHITWVPGKTAAHCGYAQKLNCYGETHVPLTFRSLVPKYITYYVEVWENAYKTNTEPIFSPLSYWYDLGKPDKRTKFHPI